MTDTTLPPQQPIQAAAPSSSGMPQWMWALVAIGTGIASGAGGASYGAERGAFASQENMTRLEHKVDELQKAVGELTIAVRVHAASPHASPHGDSR